MATPLIMLSSRTMGNPLKYSPARSMRWTVDIESFLDINRISNSSLLSSKEYSDINDMIESGWLNTMNSEPSFFRAYISPTTVPNSNSLSLSPSRSPAERWEEIILLTENGKPSTSKPETHLP